MERKDTKLDDFALSKLPLKKQQQIKRRRDAASTSFNWNALYMNADAVISSIADRLGLSKSEVLDPTSSDAAIKQAHAETHIIQETKAFFKQQGVDLDSFKRSQRGDTAILVKNIPYDCSTDELKRMFEEHGEVKKFIMPPSGVIAIVEFLNAAQCKAAFGALAYRKIKSSVLFLEKAPKGLFDSRGDSSVQKDASAGISKASASDLKNAESTAVNSAATATLFVRNLNFTTTTERLMEIFKPMDGILSARVKTKTDSKKAGQVLSMGFGFVEFRTSHQAQAALKTLDGYTLEGHKLQIRASHKGLDAAEERRRADAEKRAAGKKTKIVIKNLPFEASKKDVRALFGAYGQLRSVRVPKKMDRVARGFAFADFTTPKEAESAMDALKDTHLLGRRLVLDFADEDPENAEAEIEKMQQKVGAQVNKVAIQKLTSGGRKKFSTQVEDDDA
jgi:multiple RNA-binding domain-containing protein 1